MNNIFCENCKYIEMDNIQNHKCHTRKNIIKIQTINWYSIYNSERFKNTPMEINKDNDCKWFEDVEGIVNGC